MVRNALNNEFSRVCGAREHARYVQLCIAANVTIPVSAKTWSTLRMMQETTAVLRLIARANEDSL